VLTHSCVFFATHIQGCFFGLIFQTCKHDRQCNNRHWLAIPKVHYSKGLLSTVQIRATLLGLGLGLGLGIVGIVDLQNSSYNNHEFVISMKHTCITTLKHSRVFLSNVHYYDSNFCIVNQFR